MWVDGRRIRCPYPIDDRTLFVAHYASAEVSAHKALAWPIPTNILDTCIEFSALTSGLRGKGEGRSLLGALRYFHIHTLKDEEKNEIRELAMMAKANDRYTPDERRALLEYCMDDVVRLKKVLRKLEPFLCCRQI